MTTTYQGRTYQLTEHPTGERTAEHLKARGFDGQYYFGISEPTGRQRKTMQTLFLRCQDGRFICAL